MNRLRRFACLCPAALLLSACGSNADHGPGETNAGAAALAGAANSPAGASNGGAAHAAAGAASSTGGAPNSAGGAGSTLAGATNGGASSSAGAGNGGVGAASGGTGGRASADGGASAGGSASAGASSGGGSSVVFPPNCTCFKLGPPACTPTGHVTYTLAKADNPSDDQKKAYDLITCAMEGAVAYYNCNTTITKQVNVTYVPSVATADGNYNGSIRFGATGDMQCITAMHEIAHTVGVGTAPKWSTYSVGGVFTGETAIAQLRAITGNATDVLHSDTQHFWPYGLNYTTEVSSTADLVDHCLMVTAIRKDMGL